MKDLSESWWDGYQCSLPLSYSPSVYKLLTTVNVKRGHNVSWFLFAYSKQRKRSSNTKIRGTTRNTYEQEWVDMLLQRKACHTFYWGNPPHVIWYFFLYHICGCSSLAIAENVNLLMLFNGLSFYKATWIFPANVDSLSCIFLHVSPNVMI